MKNYQSTLKIEEVVPGYLRVIFDHPPLSLLDPESFADFRLLLDRMKTDKDLKVVVIESADPDYYISHLDIFRTDEIIDRPGAANIIKEWGNFVHGIATVPVVSICKIRARARGIGHEFCLALDMRFASMEKALVAQPEIGFSVFPGGGGLEWMPRLIGRSRTLEVALSARDIDAKTAELFGLVNRAIPDAELDEYVDNLAKRIASFNKDGIADLKNIVNKRAGVPSVDELNESFEAIVKALARPESKKRAEIMLKKGLNET